VKGISEGNDKVIYAANQLPAYWQELDFEKFMMKLIKFVAAHRHSPLKQQKRERARKSVKHDLTSIARPTNISTFQSRRTTASCRPHRLLAKGVRGWQGKKIRFGTSALKTATTNFT
jgi:hypothetical protein